MFKLGSEYSYKGDRLVYIGDIIFFCFKNDKGEVIQLNQEESLEVVEYVAPKVAVRATK